MSKTSKVKTTAIQPAASRTEAEELLARIGKNQRKVTAIESRLSDRVTKLQQEAAQEAEPLNAEIENDFQRLHLWAEANRGALLEGNSKTAKLATGELSWRVSPPKCTLTGEAAVIASLKKHGLEDAIRTKETVDKETILDDPARFDGIKGISVTQKEDFIAKPTESEIERAVTQDRRDRIAA
ncbi:MAG: host-nuclease inhibitor Gam family protein [Deltaproteobacteria bacterium]|nr:host-nuclease inhibitor Gam family protein [Deltaproteobacteria bacterium]